LKLTLIGGGGVRSPLFVMTLLRWQERVRVDELWLLDTDPARLEQFGALNEALVRRAGSPFRLEITTDPRRALEGADHVVTAVRVGQERGRVLDERIALRHGVIGQETTGPGGFAMAMRSIPAILGCARLLRQLSPNAWLYNFTNPAGLVSQALREDGFERAIGICDGANQGQASIAAWAGVPPERIRAEVFGLNHLSWTRRAWLDGQDQLPRALADDAFLREHQRMFDPRLVRRMGMHLNEYLYYFYHAEKALAALQSEAITRGEEIEALNRRLIEQLAAVDPRRDPERALRIFFGYEQRRGATYMRSDARAATRPENEVFDAPVPDEAGEGYAGVALGVIAALVSGEPLYTALNVPNQGAIEGMAAGDVVEVSCRVNGTGVHPLKIGEVPALPLSLMRAVKLYERLAVEAIRRRDRKLAVEALMAHPLVLSYSRASALVEEYLSAHREYVGEWS